MYLDLITHSITSNQEIMKNKYVSFIVIILFVIGFSSCKKIVGAIFEGTDVEAPVVNITIPAIIVLTPDEMTLGTYTQSINLDSMVRAKTGGIFGANVVSSVKVKKVTITLTNADQLNNISNFKTARVTLQSNTNNTPVQLFSVSFDDTYASTYTFNADNSPELLSYLKGSTISYTLYGSIRRITNKPLQMQVNVTLRAN